MNNERAENDFIKRGFVTNLNKDPPYVECSMAFLWNIQVVLNKFQNLFTLTHRSQN